MPNQDPTQNPQPIDTPPVQEPIVPPSFSPQSDLPPMPPAFQNIPEENPAPEAPVETQVATEPSTGLPKVEEAGSAAPPDIDISSVIKSPKKKYGTGKIIATILGLFLLVGGIGAGIALTQQKQLFQQKASGDCAAPNFCTSNCAVGKSQAGNCNTGVCCSQEAATPTPHPDCTAPNFCTSNCAVGKSQTGNCNTGVCCSAEADGPTLPTGYWPPTDGSVSCKPPTSGTVRGCITIFCPSGCGIDGGCGETTPGSYWQNYTSCDAAQSALGNYCGQVDTINENNIYCIPETGHSALKQCYPGCTPPPPKTPNPSSSPTPTPTPTGAAPYCAAVKAYSGANYVLLTPESISMIQPGDLLHFCVAGSASSGTFDKAQFTINGVELAETTATRPGSTDFCQGYTVLSTDRTMNVSSKIHHSVLGWF